MTVASRLGSALARSVALVPGLSPFGPIFGKELRVTSRRKRSYVLRVAYLGLLLLALLVGYAGEGRSGGGLARQAERQERLGEGFFIAFSIFCICAMGLVAPILTATSIGSEKLAKTLPVLMMTPINAWQIASGKLFSRMLAALTLLGLSLPVLALIRLLGGVEIQQMVAVIVLCSTFALSSAALGLFYSAFITRAYAVILLAYVTQLFLYLFIPFILALLLARNSPGTYATCLLAVHPIMAVMAQSIPDMMQGLRGGLMVPWEVCAGVQTLLAMGLLAMCAMVLRRVARQDGSTPVPVTPYVYMAPPQPLARHPATPPPMLPPPMPGNGQSFAADVPAPTVPPIYPSMGPRANREVSDNPILWREIRRPLLARKWMRWLAVGIVILLTVICYLAMASIPEALADSDSQIGFAMVFAGIYWLLTAVISATSIASEKESDTWTLLLATPVTGSTVVWGKFAGLLRRLLWPTVFILAHFVLFTLFGVINPLVILLVLWVILTFNSIWVATGLYLSLRLKKVTIAVISNLLLAVASYAVVPAVLAVIGGLLEYRSDLPELSLWLLPYWYLGSGISGISRMAGYGRNMRYDAHPTSLEFELPGRGGHVGGLTFFLIVAGIGCAHLLVTGLILVWTSARFDVIVGRAGRRLHVGAFETDDAFAPPGESTSAPIWRRATALAIDNLILRGGCLLLCLTTGVFIYLGSDTAGPADTFLLPYALCGLVVSVPVGWLYYAGFEASRRRGTPGKSILGICVTDDDGRRASFNAASMRYVASLGSGLAAGAGYLMALFNVEKRAFHDRVADTHVLKQ